MLFYKNLQYFKEIESWCGSPYFQTLGTSSHEESKNLCFVSVFLRIHSLHAFVYKESEFAIFKMF